MKVIDDEFCFLIFEKKKCEFQCVTECILNETGILKDRKFMPNVAADLAKKSLGPKSVWVPVVEDALKVCNEHGALING